MVEQELKQLIKERYKSVKAFSQVINVPYTTMDSVLKRGIQKAGIQTIIKICTELGISADSLAIGKIEPTKITSITEQEEDFIRLYRNLNDDGISRLNEYMSFLQNSIQYKRGYKVIKEEEI